MATNKIAYWKRHAIPVSLSETACEGRPDKWRERRARLLGQRYQLELYRKALDNESERVEQRLANCDEALESVASIDHLRLRPMRADRTGGGAL